MFFDMVQRNEVEAYAPRLFLAEVAGVIVRFVPKAVSEEALRKLMGLVITVPDDLFYRKAIEIALSTGSRGADAYYIGLAITLNAPLVTNDRKQATNARRAKVKAFYLVEEMSDFYGFVERG